MPNNRSISSSERRALGDNQSSMILEGFDQEKFLRLYWQQQPMLIRHTGEPFRDLIQPDELAGLACESGIESRIVRRESGQWQVSHGPVEERVFGELGERDWTLLVQAVDQVDADVADLKRRFDFLPSWRIDDIMISFAADGGGVGPHFDQYDVFLVQGLGQRRWQIGDRCGSESALREHSELRLLERFTSVQEEILGPGDVLYLPARFAHCGTSIGNSLCYSVGFRAPSLADLVRGFGDELAGSLSDDQRVTDAAPWLPSIGGELTQTTLQAVWQKLREVTDQSACFTDFFGKLVTEPRYPDRVLADAAEIPAPQLHAMLEDPNLAVKLRLNPGSRFAYFYHLDRPNLYADGEHFPCQAQQLPLVQHLCQQLWPDPLETDKFRACRPDRELLVNLIQQGSLLIDISGPGGP